MFSDNVIPSENFLFVCKSTNSCLSALVKTALVSVTGRLEYRFVMSKVARV